MAVVMDVDIVNLAMNMYAQGEYPERLIEDAVAKIETEKDQRIRQDLLF